MTTLPPEGRAHVVARLGEVANEIDAETRDVVWDTLRRLIADHREFADASWALPPEAVDQLDELAQQFAPSSSRADECLFAEHAPTLPDVRRRNNHAEYQQQLARLRQEAVARIEAEGGLGRLIEVARASPVPWSIGNALATAVGYRYVDELLPALADPDARRSQMADAYFGELFRVHGERGWEWVRGVLGGHHELPPDVAARLLLATFDYPTAWVEAEAQGTDVVQYFWKHFRTGGLGSDFSCIEFVADKLMEVGRHAGALQFLDIYGPGSSVGDEALAGLIVRGLRGLLQGEHDDELPFLQQHDFDAFFEVLHRAIETVGWEVVAELEWAYLPALGHEPQAEVLYQRMTDDPAFYVEVVLSVFPPESEDDEPVDDERRRRADNAYRLLTSWSQPPGMVDGRLNAERLDAWLDAAIELLNQAGRLSIGLVYIGHVLASAPQDDNDDWPPVVVRDLFEARQLQDLEDGFHTEIVNSRGITTRGMEDGGDQELTLAAKYRSDADRYADRWPRTAAILRQVAQGYEREAQHNEDSAERRRRGLE